MEKDVKYFNFVLRFALVIAFAAFFLILFYAFATEVTRDDEAYNEAFQQNVIADLGQDGLQNISIEKPHRSDNELKTWLGSAVSESLTLETPTLENSYDAVEKYFTASGFQAYKDYLSNSGILRSLENNGYRMSLFMEQEPLLLNSVEVDGIYRWLYQIPVTLSFIPRSATRAGENVTNRKVTLRVQIRRVPVEQSEEGMQIESWTITGRR
jgi:hypothetical protein